MSGKGRRRTDEPPALGNSPDLVVEKCLGNLGISSLDAWDVLVFLYRHRTSLASADQIARLLGYPGTAVGEALDTLESLGLIRGSRAVQGVRLYQFVFSEALLFSGGDVMRLAEHRSGRLLLTKKLTTKKLTVKESAE